jgi:hypothetical protein
MNTSDSEKIKNAIQSVIQSLMSSVMQNVMDNPFNPEKHKKYKPLYAALVPDEIFKGSHFERKFVTPFGKAWQNLAVAVAQESLGTVSTEYPIHGFIKKERLDRIAEILNELEHKRLENGKYTRNRPDWDKELSYILEGSGKDIPTTVIADIYVEDTQSNKQYAFELKAPLPNSDQTKVSKEKLLKLYAMEPRLVNEAYFALSYNPYGHKENYKWAVPNRWFNMKKDEVVLIGDEFWDKIGGQGTYQLLVNTVNEFGKKYKDTIYRDVLEIEPPTDSSDFHLS